MIFQINTQSFAFSTWNDEGVCLCAYQEPKNFAASKFATVGGEAQFPISNAGMFPNVGRLMSMGQKSPQSKICGKEDMKISKDHKKCDQGLEIWILF